MFRLITLSLCMIIACSATFASLTFSGSTGVLTTPNADVHPSNKITLAQDVYFTKDNATDQETAYLTRATYGFLHAFEVGAGYGSDNNETWMVNFKYRTPIEIGGFNTALGVIYSDSRPPRSDLRVTQIFLCGTKTFDDDDPVTPSFKVTLGGNITEFTGGGKPGKRTDGHYWVSGEMIFNNGLKTGFEIQNKSDKLDDNDPVWGVVVRYPIQKQLEVHVGYSKWSWFRGPVNGCISVGAEYVF